MKSVALLLSLGALAAATPLSLYDVEDQYPLSGHPLQDLGTLQLDINAVRLVQMEGKEPIWMTELQKINAKAKGIHFMDITDTPDLGSRPRMRGQTQSAMPTPAYKDKVNAVLKTLSTERPKKNLEKFTSFRTRHYLSETGKQSQRWLLSKINKTTAKWGSAALRDVIDIKEFRHTWGQHSIIVRINGSSKADDGVVVIGAHQDSTNMWPWLPAPGADDDGSGTVTILEAYRALLAANFRPIQTVEFHWYSAEEGGLLGSQAVANDYFKRDVNVIGMSQFDMTAWVKRGTREEVGIITDYTDPALTEFNMALVDEYLDIPYVETECGYACSDHASWRKAGYPSTFTIESSFHNSNPNIHSARDRINFSDEFSFEHMLEFSKLAVAFAIELGGWTEALEDGRRLTNA